MKDIFLLILFGVLCEISKFYGRLYLYVHVNIKYDNENSNMMLLGYHVCIIIATIIFKYIE